MERHEILEYLKNMLHERFGVDPATLSGSTTQQEIGIDSLLMVASGLLILIPGPNILGYYFAFRVVGHYFSVRGARNGLDRVTWTQTPSEPLTELRHALALDAAARLRQAESVASRLRLDHLATFFQRTAVSS